MQWGGSEESGGHADGVNAGEDFCVGVGVGLWEGFLACLMRWIGKMKDWEVEAAWGRYIIFFVSCVRNVLWDIADGFHV